MQVWNQILDTVGLRNIQVRDKCVTNISRDKVEFIMSGKKDTARQNSICITVQTS